jgi:hypothetical protein
MSDARAAELKAKLQNRRADQDIMDMRLEEVNHVLGMFIYTSWGMASFARKVFFEI